MTGITIFTVFLHPDPCLGGKRQDSLVQGAAR